LLLVLAGCVRRSPEAAVLMGFAHQPGDQIFDQDAQPEYLVFSDRLTASVFKGLTRSGRYRIAPESAPLFCPGTPVEGMHGYLLDARVDTVMGDSAIASIVLTCSRERNAIRSATDYLLLRQNGKWKVKKPLSGSEGVLM